MIEWILSSSVLILVVLGLRAALKGHISQRLRYALWSLALVRLLVPFALVDSAISVTSLAQPRIQAIERVVQTPIRSEGYEAALEEVMANFYDRQIDPAEVSQEELDQAIRENVYQQVLSEQSQSAGQTPLSAEALDAEVDSRMASLYGIDPGQVLTAVWIAGIVLMCAVFLLSNARLALNLRRTRTPLDVSHSLPVYVTDYVTTPCLFGLARSAIYLPRSAAESPRSEHILAHETTHHRHGDHIWSLLRCLCLALHWYNPLVWIAAAASKVDAELACDEATIELLGEHQRTAYGETLITMTCARRDHKDLFLTATTMNTGKQTLKERVTMIAKHPKTAIYTLIIVLLVMAIAAGCTFTGAGNQTTTPDETTGPLADTTGPEDTSPGTSLSDETLPQTPTSDDEILSGFPGDFEPQGTEASEETLHAISNLFDDYRSWYSMATTSCYMTPEEVDLSLLFYNGIHIEQTTLTDAEKQFLKNTWLGSMIGTMDFDRMKAGDMDDVLEEYFDISLDDTIKRGTQNWVYWDNTDCYYQAHNDAISQDVNILDVYIRPGGLVDVYYTLNGAETECFVMTLQVRDGRFIVCANWYVNAMTILPSASSKHGIYFPYDHGISATVPLSEEELAYFNTLFQNSLDEESVLSSFFNSYYASPEDLDLEEFLRYNVLAQTVTSGGDFDIICQREGFTEYVPVPIHKYSAEDIDEALEMYMGIGLDDLKNRGGKDGLHYLAQYDAYYNTTSDAGGGLFTADRGERELNTLRLYDDHADGSISVLTLRDDGEKWLIVSHQLAIP